MVDDLKFLTRRARTWLCKTALPLWATRGFDTSEGLFEEQLRYSGDPVRTVPRRVMVQCRQIVVYAAAGGSGVFPGAGAIATSTMRRVIDCFHESDGRPGWVFSIDRKSRPVDTKRDLYTHAFVLLALASALRIERLPAFEYAVEMTIDFLNRYIADPLHGGFWDSVPRLDDRRRQNPHMHLFEAMIALYEATGRMDFLVRGRLLRDLAVNRFLDPTTGALREYFRDDWQVHPALGEGSVEPGHLFEWAWLLRRWQMATAEDQSEPVRGLLHLACSQGLDATRGRIVDEIDECGQLRRASSRSWPHTEALKALTMEASLAGREHDPVVAAILKRLLDIYCRVELAGGWVDQVDEADRSISEVMPASSLYHIYFGIMSVAEMSSSGVEKHQSLGIPDRQVRRELLCHNTRP